MPKYDYFHVIHKRDAGVWRDVGQEPTSASKYICRAEARPLLKGLKNGQYRVISRKQKR